MDGDDGLLAWAVHSVSPTTHIPLLAHKLCPALWKTPWYGQVDYGALRKLFSNHSAGEPGTETLQPRMIRTRRRLSVPP